MRLKKCFASYLLAHIAALNDVVYELYHSGLNFVTDFDSDGEEEFGFDCCSALADDRHVHPYEHRPGSQ
jgi:hypothetical protein